MSAAPQAAREWRATLAGQTITIVSRPGLPGWDAVPPAFELLAEGVPAAPGARVLLLGCGHGALAVALARRSREVWLRDSSVIALELSQATLRRNGVGNAQLCPAPGLPDELRGGFDLAVVAPPPNRVLARRWLVEAHGALREGGQLFLAGPNDGGIQPIIADLGALFGNAAQLAYRRRNRLAQASKADARARADWAGLPGIAPGTWHSFSITVDGAPLPLRSLPGVFAYDRLDDGSALLLAHMPPCAGARVLDAGCGCGVLGLVAARRGAAQVDLVDADLLAVASASENSARLGLGQARARAADGIGGLDGPYDLIVSNPPFHSGKAVSYDSAQAMLAQAPALLAPAGQLAIVTNAFIRYERLLAGLFGRVEVLADDRRYRVLLASLPHR